VSIGHRATDRDIFVRGALRALRWAASQTEPGLYDMGDVLRG
jgi:4-hydroxy-tetrahydrodipicolinate reductase